MNIKTWSNKTETERAEINDRIMAFIDNPCSNTAMYFLDRIEKESETDIIQRSTFVNDSGEITSPVHIFDIVATFCITNAVPSVKPKIEDLSPLQYAALSTLGASINYIAEEAMTIQMNRSFLCENKTIN